MYYNFIKINLYFFIIHVADIQELIVSFSIKLLTHDISVFFADWNKIFSCFQRTEVLQNTESVFNRIALNEKLHNLENKLADGNIVS